jgi:hypothetical protein
MLAHAHSGIRYLVLLAGLAALGYALYGLVTRRPYDDRMRQLGGIFALLLFVQIVVGIGVLFTGRFNPGLGVHVILMIFATAAAQIVPSVMRRRPMEQRSYGPHVVGTLVALALVVAGILAVPGATLLGSAR